MGTMGIYLSNLVEMGRIYPRQRSTAVDKALVGSEELTRTHGRVSRCISPRKAREGALVEASEPTANA